MSGLNSQLQSAVRKLTKQSDDFTRRKGGANTGDLVPVDYFALHDLLAFYREAKEAARNVVIARDALHQAFFSSGTNVDGSR